MTQFVRTDKLAEAWVQCGVCHGPQLIRITSRQIVWTCRSCHAENETTVKREVRDA